MANRRMFSKEITESDSFLDLPLSAQALYFHLGMSADDDGFVSGSKRVQRTIGAEEDDLRLLLAKNFLLSVGDGIVVVRHWKINNYIQRDRYRPTVYAEQKQMLFEKENKAYSLESPPIQAENLALDTPCIQPVSNLYAQDRIGKVRKGKNRKGKSKGRFTPPTLDEVREYAESRNSTIDPQRFFDYYQATGWKDVNGKPVKSWKGKLITWEARGNEHKPSTKEPEPTEYEGSW